MGKPRFEIPSIDDATLVTLAERIRPVVRRDGDLYYIKPVDLRRIAFTWDPKVTSQAVGLEPVISFKTLHRYAYHGFFKPSIAEVLAQIPADLLDDNVVAFEVKGPKDADDLNKDSAALNAGFHVAMTTLYSRRADARKPSDDLSLTAFDMTLLDTTRLLDMWFTWRPYWSAVDRYEQAMEVGGHSPEQRAAARKHWRRLDVYGRPDHFQKYPNETMRFWWENLCTEINSRVPKSGR